MSTFDEVQFRKNLEGMGFQLPPGDLGDPKYVEKLLTDFKSQLQASGIDPEAFETLVKNYQKELIAESEKPALRSPNAEPKSNSIALGTAAYLVAIQLALYELLTENMKFFNEIAAQNSKISNDLANTVAGATEASIKIDSAKEQFSGIAKLASGAVGVGLSAGPRAFRGKHEASGQIKDLGGRSKNINAHIDTLNKTTSPLGAGATTTAGTGHVVNDAQHAVNIRRKLDNSTLGHSHEKVGGNEPVGLTPEEITYIKNHADPKLKNEVLNKLHAERGGYQEQIQRLNADLNHIEQQIGQFSPILSGLTDAGSGVYSSVQTAEKAKEEKAKVLGEASKQSISQSREDAAQSAAKAERQQEAALEALKKFDADSKH